MGTDKRERQKTNRQLKLEEMARDARKRKSKRRGLQIGIGIPLAIAIVFGLVRLLGDTSTTGGNAATGTTAVTTASDLGPVASIDPTSTGAAPLPCPAADGSSPKVDTFPAAPGQCIDPTKTYTIEVDTSQGRYTAVLDAVKAPITVNNFVYLARYHYFDATTCHRVVPGFVVQCGDPTATGSGGPGYEFADELPTAGEYKLGSLAMANSSRPGTNGSQFFVISGDKGVALPPSYSLFGQVTKGLETIAAIDALAVGDGPPSQTVTINSVTVTES